MASRHILKPSQPLGQNRPFHVVSTVSELRDHRKYASQVGLVPTMGALHEGHLALIRQAARENTDVYVSVYVNPTQFGVTEDLSSYPRTWPGDQEKLNRLRDEFARDPNTEGQLSVIFMPSTKEMYPCAPPTSEIDGVGSFVTITPLATRLEGASRPVFFRGVATVCMKLFNIVKPNNVYFGQKDIQQTFVIKRMVQDFHLDTIVRVGPTVRESDGLAMSSRNVYLGARRRGVALALLKSLQAIDNAFSKGLRERSQLLKSAMDLLAHRQNEQLGLPPSQRALFEIDYISIADPNTLDELEEVDPKDGAIVSGAIRMLAIEDPQDGETLGEGDDKTTVRLIDNIQIRPLHT